MFAEGAREFIAGWKFDFMLNTGVIGSDDATAGSVTEETDNGRMSAADDADNAAFGAARSGQAAEASDFGNDGVAVHGVFHVVARNEDVTIDIGKGNIGDDEAVAIVMKDEAATNFVARSGFVLRDFFDGFGGSGAAFLRSRGGLKRAAEKKTAVGEFLD